MAACHVMLYAFFPTLPTLVLLFLIHIQMVMSIEQNLGCFLTLIHTIRRCLFLFLGCFSTLILLISYKVYLGWLGIIHIWIMMKVFFRWYREGLKILVILLDRLGLKRITSMDLSINNINFIWTIFCLLKFYLMNNKYINFVMEYGQIFIIKFRKYLDIFIRK